MFLLKRALKIISHLSTGKCWTKKYLLATMVHQKCIYPKIINISCPILIFSILFEMCQHLQWLLLAEKRVTVKTRCLWSMVAVLPHSWVKENNSIWNGMCDHIFRKPIPINKALPGNLVCVWMGHLPQYCLSLFPYNTSLNHSLAPVFITSTCQYSYTDSAT